MKIVVGLGNPGPQYVGTRHNVGFDVLDRTAERLGWVREGEFDRRAKSRFDALTFDGMITRTVGGDEKVMLMKPMTFMNLSGRSVQQAAAYFQVSPADVLVVLDDLALPVGRLRIRAGGSNGGHNGLKSIEQMLATNAYPRLRIGIDGAPPRVATSDYVLGRPSAEQVVPLTNAINRSCGAILSWVDRGVEATMNAFNVET